MIRAIIILLGVMIVVITIVAFQKPFENGISQSLWAPQNTLIIKEKDIKRDTLFGSVVADTLVNTTTSQGGVVEMVNCQPGSQVEKGDIIAVLRNPNDSVITQNNLLQAQSVNNQLNNIDAIKVETQQNFNNQQQALLTQQDNTIQQISALEKNLQNLNTQRQLSSGDSTLQIKTLQDQLVILENAKKIEQDRFDSYSSNTRSSLKNTIADGIQKVGDVFGITNAEKSSSYIIYLGVKNSQLLGVVRDNYFTISQLIDQINAGASGEKLSMIIKQAADYFKNAADSAFQSVSSNTLPQRSTDPSAPSIDGFYNTFLGFANNLTTTKSTFDSTYVTYTATINNLNNQLLTTKNNLDSLVGYKKDQQDINVQNSITSLESQIQGLKNTLRNIEFQLSGLNNSQESQLLQLSNQSLGLQQQYNSLANILDGETILAKKSGIVKAKYVSEGTTVSANTMLCQITPFGKYTFKIQVFSAERLPVGSEVVIRDDGTVLGTGSIEFELPYTDALTQTYIYDIKNIDFYKNLKEGQRLEIDISQDTNGGELWIPLNYIVPKLEGYYVRKKNGDDFIETLVEVGIVDNGKMKILSGLNVGDTIAY